MRFFKAKKPLIYERSHLGNLAYPNEILCMIMNYFTDLKTLRDFSNSHPLLREAASKHPVFYTLKTYYARNRNYKLYVTNGELDEILKDYNMVTSRNPFDFLRRTFFIAMGFCVLLVIVLVTLRTTTKIFENEENLQLLMKTKIPLDVFIISVIILDSIPYFKLMIYKDRFFKSLELLNKLDDKTPRLE